MVRASWPAHSIGEQPIATDAELRALPWRTGRKVGRTVYAQVFKDPSDMDVLIGMMDTPLLASAAVSGHNYLLDVGILKRH